MTAESSDSDSAIRVALEQLRNVVPFDSASVQELRGDRLVIINGIGFIDLDVIRGESFELNNPNSPNGEVVHRRRPMIVGDTEQYRAFRRGLHVGAGIRSWMGIPLIDGETVRGILTLDKEEADFYKADHLSTAIAFATRVARAMGSAG